MGGIVAVGCWGERSEPALRRSRRRREAGRWSGPAWSTRLAVMAAVVTVNDVLDGHVSLDVECLDRIYLNGYVPNLQVGGQVVSFMTAHLGYPIPSPAIMEKSAPRSAGRWRRSPRTTGFRWCGSGGTTARSIGEADSWRGRRRPAGLGWRDWGCAGVRAGVHRDQEGAGKAVWFSFTKADRRVTCYYFYLWDDDFGPAVRQGVRLLPVPDEDLAERA